MSKTYPILPTGTEIKGIVENLDGVVTKYPENVDVYAAECHKVLADEKMEAILITNRTM